jgi:hypothetical protein
VDFSSPFHLHMPLGDHLLPRLRGPCVPGSGFLLTVLGGTAYFVAVPKYLQLDWVFIKKTGRFSSWFYRFQGMLRLLAGSGEGRGGWHSRWQELQ